MAEVSNNTAVEIGLADLSLDEGEDEGWRADLSGEEMEEGMALCAVCSFLTASVIQYHAMNKTLANLWHPHGGVTISDLGEKRFMFRLYYEIDFDRFLQVQIHDLPSGLINENMGRQFGNFIGDFLEYDTKAVGRGYRGFMRIRERIDIRGPLKQRKKIILSPKKVFMPVSNMKAYLFSIFCVDN
ncbi:hypothetical protein Goshw_015809 [Gossypium schwendimanii]|uniref:DUF4283 domain-containing protein n=1 Tax=Gossypium schwendimanii TaxID=34291 RepID=A0A7J9KLH3_GOSSC|nr:hypothetical protein [Gossypium schwendimanii]